VTLTVQQLAVLAIAAERRAREFDAQAQRAAAAGLKYLAQRAETRAAQCRTLASRARRLMRMRALTALPDAGEPSDEMRRLMETP